MIAPKVNEKRDCRNDITRTEGKKKRQFIKKAKHSERFLIEFVAIKRDQRTR